MADTLPIPLVRFLEDGWRRATFLEAVRRSGSVPWSADVVGLTPTQARTAVAQHPEFRDEVQDAQELYRHTVRQEVHRRAVVGVPRVVHSGGKVFMIDPPGTPADPDNPPAKVPLVEPEYSDALLKVLLEGEFPETYGARKHQHEVRVQGQVAFGVMVVPPVLSEAAWEAAAPALDHRSARLLAEAPAAPAGAQGPPTAPPDMDVGAKPVDLGFLGEPGQGDPDG